ncbi:MAG: biotin/lipoyl-binding protein, partial [Planctomycetaceae bacterium]|nr:biotin/lipoyl-binding protein [Planctomycetaceae bacterium]
MIQKLFIIVLVAAGLLAALVFSQQRSAAVTVSGFIEADEMRLGSRVGGRVRRVEVEEGDVVQPGQVLVELEAFDLQDRRAQAEAELSQQLARHEQLEAGYRTEEITQAEARLAQAEADFEALRN